MALYVGSYYLYILCLFPVVIDSIWEFDHNVSFQSMQAVILCRILQKYLDSWGICFSLTLNSGTLTVHTQEVGNSVTRFAVA